MIFILNKKGNKKMKKLRYIGLCFIILLLSGNVLAQQQDIENKIVKGIKLSFRTGFLLSNMIGEGVSDHASIQARLDNKNEYIGKIPINVGKKLLPGCKAGFGIVLDFHKTVAIDVGIDYEMKGWKTPVSTVSLETEYINADGLHKGEYINVTETASRAMHYITVPVKAEIRYKLFYCSPGFYSGVLLYANDFGQINAENKKILITKERTQIYTRFDLGLLINMGVSVPLSEKDFLKIGIGGAWSVVNIARRMPGVTFYPIYNQSFNLELKYERKIKQEREKR
jgi:hypothetical protein